MAGDAAALLRRMLLAVLLLGLVGVTAELLLLEHTESQTQWIPLIVLACAVIACIAAGVAARPVTLVVLRIVMLAMIAAGALGMLLHYRGNVEFALERYPDISGLTLFRRAIVGATPALAPGTLIQFGLLGLLYTWRHPRLRTA